MVLTKDEKSTLELFNETANKIIESPFLKESEEKSISITVNHLYDKNMKHRGRTYEVEHHNQIFIDSVIIPVRLFFLDRDNISFRKMSELYEKLTVPEDYSKTYEDVRKSLNLFLDGKALTVYHETHSRRYLSETIVYGQFIHLEPEKIQQLKEWKKDEISWNILYMEFQSILYHISHHLQDIVKLNNMILKKYSS